MSTFYPDCIDTSREKAHQCTANQHMQLRVRRRPVHATAPPTASRRPNRVFLTRKQKIHKKKGRRDAVFESSHAHSQFIFCTLVFFLRVLVFQIFANRFETISGGVSLKCGTLRLHRGGRLSERTLYPRHGFFILSKVTTKSNNTPKSLNLSI